MYEIGGEVSTSEGLGPPAKSEEAIGDAEEAGSPTRIHEEACPHPPESGDQIADGGLNRKQGRGKQQYLENGASR